jgi:alkylation response protein AidB-like acyl-CoA dehydrogenase
VPLAPIPVRPQRLVYLGTPAMSVPPLQALVTSGWDVAQGTAAALATEAGFACAKDCIQVLGGIGYTWEHDAEEVLDAGADLGVVVAYGG